MRAPARADERQVRTRLAIVSGLAVALAGSDLAVKLLVSSDPSYAHQRAHGWVTLSEGVLLVTLLLAGLPSRLLSVGVGILAGGTLGNLLWARSHEWVVPNPFVVHFGDDGVAFNLADVYVVCGTLLFMGASMRIVIRYRHVLPQSTVMVRLARRLLTRQS